MGTTEFNGVLFVLREPNSSGESVPKGERTWLDALLNGEPVKNHGKYAKTFKALLEYTDLKEKNLKYCDLDNIRPEGGESSTGPEYKSLSSSDKSKLFLDICRAHHPKYIFTCIDIFDAVLKNNSTLCSQVSRGVVYSARPGKPKRKMLLNYDSMKITVFEIYHPGLGWNIQKP